MKNEEIALIQSKRNAAIIAPAGHGKTEMIAELVKKLDGKKLVLTHTNAGVSALSRRFEKHKIAKNNYALYTISAFCMKWCQAYPKTAKVNPEINPGNKNFYPEQYKGAANIFSHQWARDVLCRTYQLVIVDEYQDCSIEQHNIFLAINKSLKVYVLGDPLQSIFDWAGDLVSWQNLGFEILENEIETRPWRWEKSNKELGQYLTKIREEFQPALNKLEVSIPTKSIENCVKCVSAVTPRFLNGILREYGSVLYLTQWPKQQCQFSQYFGGLLQNDEAQDFKDLYKFAQRLDFKTGMERARVLFDFISQCATHITTELKSYKKHIDEGNCNFNQIIKYPELGNRILTLCQNNGLEDIINVLQWVKDVGKFKLYRKELLSELIRSIKFSKDTGVTIEDAARQIRMNPNHQSRYSNFKRLSSRPVLSKGLEFDCVIIDCKAEFTPMEMYVAMTRAMRMIYFICDKDSVTLKWREKKAYNSKYGANRKLNKNLTK